MERPIQGRRPQHPLPHNADDNQRELSYLQCVDKLGQRCEQEKNVVALWVHGSRGRGNNQAGSDLDITIVHDGSKVDEVRAMCRQEIGEPILLFDFYEDDLTDGWYHNGFEVGLRVISQEQLKAVASSFYSSLDNVDQHQDFIRHGILSGRPIIDKVGILRSMQSDLGDMPEAIQVGLFDRHLGRGLQKIAWLEARPVVTSPFERLRHANLVIDSLSRATYALNGTLYIRGMKYLSEDLGGMRPSLAFEFTEMTTLVNSNGDGAIWLAPCNRVITSLAGEFKTRFPDVSLSKRVEEYLSRLTNNEQ